MPNIPSPSMVKEEIERLAQTFYEAWRQKSKFPDWQGLSAIDRLRWAEVAKTATIVFKRH